MRQRQWRVLPTPGLSVPSLSDSRASLRLGETASVRELERLWAAPASHAEPGPPLSLSSRALGWTMAVSSIGEQSPCSL